VLVSEINDPDEMAFAHKLIQDRRPNWYWKLKKFHGNTPIQLYKASPQQVWMNDSGEKDDTYIDVRTEVKL
jgi:hypothetical protein